MYVNKLVGIELLAENVFILYLLMGSLEASHAALCVYIYIFLSNVQYTCMNVFSFMFAKKYSTQKLMIYSQKLLVPYENIACQKLFCPQKIFAQNLLTSSVERSITFCTRESSSSL